MTSLEDAFEVCGDSASAGPFVFTCEHASNRLPLGIEATAADRVLLDDHWGWDLGAGDVARRLASLTGSQAVLSRFSRLVADPNRPLDDPTFIPVAIDGQMISFNRSLSDAEVARRASLLFTPFHDAVDDTLRTRLGLGSQVHLVAIHSFTPLYLGRQRAMEVGVLFDDYDEDAWQVESLLASEGFESVLNAPYSGKGDAALIYSAQRHGRAHGIKYLELEIRQDLIDTLDKAHAVAERIARALDCFRPSTT